MPSLLDAGSQRGSLTPAGVDNQRRTSGVDNQRLPPGVDNRRRQPHGVDNPSAHGGVRRQQTTFLPLAVANPSRPVRRTPLAAEGNLAAAPLTGAGRALSGLAPQDVAGRTLLPLLTFAAGNPPQTRAGVQLASEEKRTPREGAVEVLPAGAAAPVHRPGAAHQCSRRAGAANPMVTPRTRL